MARYHFPFIYTNAKMLCYAVVTVSLTLSRRRWLIHSYGTGTHTVFMFHTSSFPPPTVFSTSVCTTRIIWFSVCAWKIFCMAWHAARVSWHEFVLFFHAINLNQRPNIITAATVRLMLLPATSLFLYIGNARYQKYPWHAGRCGNSAESSLLFFY